MSIKNNTTSLHDLLEQVNSLPEAGTIDTSDATAVAEDIIEGKTAYGPDGKITGTFTLLEELEISSSELLELTDLIEHAAAFNTLYVRTSAPSDDFGLNGDFCIVRGDTQ